MSQSSNQTVAKKATTSFQRVLIYIRAHLAEKGFAPSMREIGAACQIRSTRHVKYILDVLQERGLITYEYCTARSIRLVQSENSRWNKAAALDLFNRLRMR